MHTGSAIGKGYSVYGGGGGGAYETAEPGPQAERLFALIQQIQNLMDSNCAAASNLCDKIVGGHPTPDNVKQSPGAISPCFLDRLEGALNQLEASAHAVGGHVNRIGQAF